MAKRLGITRQSMSEMIANGRIRKRSYDVTKSGRYKIDPVLAMEDISENSDSPPAPSSSKKPDPSPAPDIPAAELQEPPEMQTATLASLAEMRRKKIAVSIKKDLMEMRIREGELVEKERVFSALYDFGQSIRQNLQVIPNKVVDDVMACRTRNEAHRIIADAIDEALADLVRAGELNFQKR